MSASDTMPVIALDGGGTRCRLALEDDGAVTVVEAGPANASTDFDGTVRRVRQALAQLAGMTGRNCADLVRFPAFLGLAGVIGDDIADRLRAALPFVIVRIGDDRRASLRGALGTQDGAIAHCGTGSFLGGQMGGDVRLLGGWGPVLGDEASAQWIARKALAAVLDRVDGRGCHTPLTERLLSDFGGASGIVGFAGGASPSEFGAIAPLVTEFAQQGDPVAEAVMGAGAGEIAQRLPCVGWAPGAAICLTGGIGPYFADYLPTDIQSDLIAPEAEPLYGALALAREFAEEIARECR